MYTYVLVCGLVFVGIAFQLLELESNAGVQASTSFSQYCAGIFAQATWQNWCNSVRLVDILVQTCFISSVHKFSVGSGLYDDHSSTFILLPLRHFVINLVLYLGSSFCWKTKLWLSFIFRAEVLRFCFSISR